METFTTVVAALFLAGCGTEDAGTDHEGEMDASAGGAIGGGGAPSDGGRSGSRGEPDGASGGAGGRETEGGVPDGSCRPPGAGGAPARPPACPEDPPGGRACSDFSLSCAYPELCTYDFQPLPVCEAAPNAHDADAGNDAAAVPPDARGDATPDDAAADATASEGGAIMGHWVCPL